MPRMSIQIQFPDLPEAKDPAKTLEWLQANARVEGDTADQGPHISMIVVYGTGTKITGKLPVNVVDFRPTKQRRRRPSQGREAQYAVV